MKQRLLLAAAAACGVLVAAQALALPDLARGRAAAERGDLAGAEADLVPLAERGYVDAMVGLARLYAEQDTPDAAARAAHWYRRAAEQDPSLRLALARNLVRAGITSNPQELERLLQQLAADQQSAALPLQLRLYRELPQLASAEQVESLAQRVAQSSLAEERAEAIAWYRDHRLAKPEYQQKLAALCERDRALVETCYADLTLHFRTVGDAGAVETLRQETAARFAEGRMTPETLERVSRYLADDTLPGPAYTQAAYQLLAKIDRPTPTVLARRARLLLAQPGLDPKADAEALLQQAHEQGSAEAAMQLGRLYLDDTRANADPVRAEALLRSASQSLPSAYTWLGRLYERGYLGRPDPQRALDFYLRAARAGYSNADFALARMYWARRGIQLDAPQAYCFARLAEHQGHPSAAALLDQMRAAMSQEQIDLGQQLAQAEWNARLAAQVPAAAGHAQLANAENAHP